MNLKYIYKCGCILTKENSSVVYSCQIINGKRKQTSYYCCPKHKELLGNRQITCEKCGAIRILEKSGGSIPRLCKSCQKKHKKKKHKAYSNKYYRENANKVKIYDCITKQFDRFRDDSRWDCKERSNCLTVYDEFDSMPCKPCKYYRPVPLFHDAMATKLDYRMGL